MKITKTALLVAVLFIGLLSPLAATENNTNNTITRYYNGYGETFTFVERGITFSIFQNGEFDFYMNSRRGGVNAGIDLGGISISYNSGYNYDAYVQYDDYGAIVQVENIPIYYDYYGRISQAGNVRIHYNGQRLARVGGLYVHYNSYGHYSHYTGFINRWNRNYVFHPYHNYFVRPLFTSCIVSFNPYRRSYRPHRYDYYTDSRYGYKNKRRTNRSYRSVASRVRTNNDNRRVSNRRSNDRSRVARSTNDVRRRSTTQRQSVQSNRNRQTNNTRRTQDVRRNSTTTAQRRSIAKPSARQNRTVQERSKPRVSQQRRTVERRATPRINKENRTIQRRSQQNTRTQSRKAPQRRIAQNRNNSKQSVRKHTTVRKQSSRTPQKRTVSRTQNSRKRKG